MKIKYPILLVLLSMQPVAQAEDLEVITAPCFNCPDISTVAIANEFDGDTYYQEVLQAISDNLPATAIHSSLSTVISQDHKILTYSEVWSALTETDEDPNNSDNVILLYRGISIPKFSNGSGTQSTDPDNWNREHTWPKSHGFSSDSFEAYTDIHHLRPTDISVNSSRGNLDFDNSDTALTESPINRVDDDSFEPRDDVKGDVARMAFYMDTRYNGADVTPDLQVVDRLTSTGEAALGRLCRLIEWHNADPVDATEQNRNNRIYEFQGNRNPFIDHPEWVDILFTADACTDTETPDDTDPVDPEPTDPDDGETDTPASTATLFISEYIEGSSYNKAIELYNPSSNDIDLATEGYKLGRFSNGGTSATNISLSGVIAANSTFVIAHSSASDEITAVANLLTGSLSHNGDDAYVLYKGDQVIDSFGNVGEDPGSAWGTDDLSTKDNTLRRNPEVISGDTTFNDDFSPASQWTGYGTDEFSGLGEHTIINPEIFISEYIEGSSYNKALELYNPAGSSVDLSSNNYQLARFTNGSTTGVFIDLTGVIASGDVFVIANSAAADEILNVADQLSGDISHNGDDAYVLYKDGVVIDSFGRVGEDPGSEWGTDLQSTKDNTLVRNSAVTAGDTVTDDVFDPTLEWDGYAKDTFDYLGAHNASDSTDSTEPEVVEVGVCLEPATLISAIQGNSDESPLLDEIHIIEGVVTAAFPDLGGYFVQEQLTDEDGDATTSEGIFVVNNDEIYPTENSIVRVVGRVTESYNKTQLVAADAVFDCGTGTVTETLLSLPFETADAPEALEGMLITLSDELTVSDNYSLGQYGEVTLSNGRLFNPTNLFLPNSDEAIALAQANTLNTIILDDNVNGTNPENIIYPTGGLLASNTLRVGDSVSSLTGIIDYSFSAYRVLPTVDPVFVQSNPRTESPELIAGNLTIASINVLNLFNGDGLGEGFPTSRGADTLIEYERQVAKTVSALVAMDADIVGLMEIENDGFEETSTIVELVTKLNEALGETNYAYVDAGSTIGTDEIAVGLLYKTATVTPSAAVLVNTDSIFNRPPVAQTFSVTGSDEAITVIVNHFKSKGCGGASDDDADQGDGQSCYNAKRTAQAQALIDWISTDTLLSTQPNMLIMGDLNAYAKEDPITTFTASGYINIIEQFAGAEAYSYAYQGLFGYLDHALVSSDLADKIVDAGEWHINADEPRALDYNVEYKSDTQIDDFYADDAYRMSDHDPVVVSLFFEPSAIPSLLGDWDGDNDVDWKDIFQFFAAIHKHQDIDMSFDLNGDNIINLRDVRAMAGLCTYRDCRVIKVKKPRYKKHKAKHGKAKYDKHHKANKHH